MSASMNIHHAKSIAVADFYEDGIEWFNIVLTGKYPDQHTITVFDMTVRDLYNACERALHEDVELVPGHSER